jgi:hypothetical protein
VSDFPLVDKASANGKPDALSQGEPPAWIWHVVRFLPVVILGTQNIITNRGEVNHNTLVVSSNDK